MKGNKKTITLFIIATMILSILSAFIALPVMAEPIVDLETMTGDVMSTSNQIFVLPLTFLNGVLPPDNVMGLLVASIIFVVLITNVNEIEKVMRRLIFGHHPGPPHFAVWFLSLVRALEGIVVYFTVIVVRYNNMKVDTDRIDYKSTNDIPFSLGETTDVYASITG